MAALMSHPYTGEISAANYNSESRIIPDDFQYFPDVAPPEPIQDLVNEYNYAVHEHGAESVLSDLPEVQHADSGLSFAKFGEPSEVLVLMQNPFATDLSPIKRFRGQFLYDSMKASGVVGPDGVTPQVIQVASACHDTDIPLKPREHLRLASGDTSPVADKIAEVVFGASPEAQRIISVGYSLSAFLTPDILISLGREKDILAALIANPPGVQPESMRNILGHFAHAGANMSEHLVRSGLQLLEPKNLVSKASKICEKAGVIADVVWRPTNLSLWRAFSRGKLLERVQTLHRLMPEVVIDFAFGYEDSLCCPDVLEKFLKGSDYKTAVIEHGDHSWGLNLTRSMGHLATEQIREVLGVQDPVRPQLLQAA